MKRFWFLLTLQFALVLAYAKFGYFATGDAGADWGRFFSVTNQLVLCGWVIIKGVSKKERKTALFFNLLLAILWFQHYIPWLNYYIEVRRKGIFVPVLACIVLCLLTSLFMDRKK